MRICIFSLVTYWHGIRGGMEIHGKLLSEGLTRRGHEITIISTRHPEGKEFEEKDGIRLHYLRNTTFGSKRKGWEKESLKKFLELDKNDHFDLICGEQPIIPMGLVKDKKGRKTASVAIMHGHGGMMLLSEFRQTFSHKTGFNRLVKHILSFLYYHFIWEQPLLKRYHAIIAVSNEVARSVQRWFLINDKKIYTIYNGVDPNLFQPSNTQRIEIRKAHNIGDDEKLILFMSFVTKQKGLHLLIKALRNILDSNNQVKLMVVGEGDYLTEAKKFVTQLGLDRYVLFAGHILREDIPHYINASDIFILPTLRQEGMPFSLLEAMACQKPVIASKIGGILSAIDDGVNGLLISPGDVNELVKGLIFLLDNKEVANKLATNARKKVMEKFSVERMVEETINVFELAPGSKKK